MSYKAEPCAFPGCRGRNWGQGLCTTHIRQRREGKALTPTLTKRRWTPDMVARLRELQKTKTYKQIGAILGFSESAVEWQARRVKPVPSDAGYLGKPAGDRCDTCWLRNPCNSTHDIREYATRRRYGGEARMPLRSKMA